MLVKAPHASDIDTLHCISLQNIINSRNLIIESLKSIIITFNDSIYN